MPLPRGLSGLPEKGCLAGTRLELNALLKAAESPLKPLTTLWGGMTRIYLSSDFFLAGPVLGAPMAVMTLEEILRSQAKAVIFCGLAGSLSPELGPGHVLVPSAAYSSEGTSQHYPGGELRPNPALYETVSQVGEIWAKAGQAWSTDAPFRETAELRAKFMEKGAKSVDMETSALFSAASFRGAKLAAILIISDVFSPEGWKPSLGHPSFKLGLSRAAGLAWESLSRFRP
jgi:purine-nucleoside phosphorylase